MIERSTQALSYVSLFFVILWNDKENDSKWEVGGVQVIDVVKI